MTEGAQAALRAILHPRERPIVQEPPKQVLVNQSDALVLVFCGPHESNQVFSPRPHRLMAGIVLAQIHRLRMVVAGDAWQGKDLALSLDRAAEAGVDAKGVYDPQARTIADARSVVNLLGTKEYEDVSIVLVVTDWWHVDRAVAMLEGEWAKSPHAARKLVFMKKGVLNCPTPPIEQIEAEIRGTDDYHAGRPYDPVVGDWTGKPVLPRTESPDGDANEGS